MSRKIYPNDISREQYRNTAAHAPKVTWPISEQDALDILSTVSLVHDA